MVVRFYQVCGNFCKFTTECERVKKEWTWKSCEAMCITMGGIKKNNVVTLWTIAIHLPLNACIWQCWVEVNGKRFDRLSKCEYKNWVRVGCFFMPLTAFFVISQFNWLRQSMRQCKIKCVDELSSKAHHKMRCFLQCYVFFFFKNESQFTIN